MEREQGITLAEHFRALASSLRGQAAASNSPAHRAECERLAECYATLAERSGPLTEEILRQA